ncbi:A24 family peptidase [Microbaculum marinum]|uniref:A24 family peptidase n=1 Tax=Microbaculum marinum TaxID=1764581 RepID=A0AAW9RZV0_9HYPH
MTAGLARVSPSARRQLAAAAIGAAAGAAAAAPLLPASHVFGSAVLCAAMAAIAYDDALRLRVPDRWVYGALVTGIAWNVVLRLRSEYGLPAAVGIPLLSAIVCGGAFLAVREAFYRLRGVDGLGFGDVKLAAAGGAWLGWEAFAFAVVVAAAGALGFVGAAALRGRRWDASRRLAFGAFLAPAIWAVWIAWQIAGNG